jgi:cytochrome c oxidase subunit 2
MSPRIRLLVAMVGGLIFAIVFSAVVLKVEGLSFSDLKLRVIPENYSAHGGKIDDIFWIIFWITTIIFIAVEVALVVFLARYVPGDGEKKAHYTHGNNTLEIVWTIAPALICVFIAFSSKAVWSEVKQTDPKTLKDPFVVEVSAKQFAWRVRYPNRKVRQAESYDAILKEFGQVEEKQIDPTTDRNFFGIVPADPVGKDDIQQEGELVVPVNRPVVVRLRSQDVLHSFFLPFHRVKQDAVPGWTIDVVFTPVKTGEWEIACAELCGLGHTNMKGTIKVVTDEELKQYLEAAKLGKRLPRRD